MLNLHTGNHMLAKITPFFQGNHSILWITTSLNKARQQALSDTYPNETFEFQTITDKNAYDGVKEKIETGKLKPSLVLLEYSPQRDQREQLVKLIKASAEQKIPAIFSSSCTSVETQDMVFKSGASKAIQTPVFSPKSYESKAYAHQIGSVLNLEG